MYSFTNAIRHTCHGSFALPSVLVRKSGPYQSNVRYQLFTIEEVRCGSGTEHRMWESDDKSLTHTHTRTHVLSLCVSNRRGMKLWKILKTTSNHCRSFTRKSPTIIRKWTNRTVNYWKITEYESGWVICRSVSRWQGNILAHCLHRITIYCQILVGYSLKMACFQINWSRSNAIKHLYTNNECPFGQCSWNIFKLNMQNLCAHIQREGERVWEKENEREWKRVREWEKSSYFKS